MSRDDSDAFDPIDDISEENDENITAGNDSDEAEATTLSSDADESPFGELDIDSFFEETSRGKREDSLALLGPDDNAPLSNAPKQAPIADGQGQRPPVTMDALFGKFSFEDEPSFARGLSTGSSKGLGQQRATQQPKAVTQGTKAPAQAQASEVKAANDSDSLSLFEWCRQFRFTAGVEYIKLTRRHPALYEGVDVSGFLENLSGPIDEEGILNTYGGGTYELDAHQLDGRNLTRRVSGRIVLLAGNPRIYKGRDGKLYPFTKKTYEENPEAPSFREENMLLGRRQHAQRIANKFEEEMPYAYGSSNRGSGMTNGPAAVINSAAELFRMTQAQQAGGKGDDTKTLEILRAAQSDVQTQMAATAKHQQEIYQQMLSAKEAEVERIRREQEALIEKTSRPLSEALNTISTRADNEVQTLREQLFRLETEYRERVAEFKDTQSSLALLHQKEKENLLNHFQKEKEDIRSSYMKQIELLKSENTSYFLNFQKEKEELKATHMAQIEAVRQEYRSREHDIRQQSMSSSSENLQALKLQMETLRDSHQAQLNNAQKDSQTTINNLYQEISKLREDARERESKAREEAFKRESDLKMQHLKELGEIRNDLNERMSNLRLENDKREKELKESSHRSEKELKATYETRERDLRERFDEREKTNKEALEAKYQGTIDSLREKLEVLKSNSDEKVQQYIKDTERREKHMQAALETNYKAQMSILEAERDRLRNDVDSMRRELDSSRKERKEMTDPITKLKEIQSFKENLQRLGFMPDDEKDDEDERIRQIQTELMLLKKKDDDEDEDEDDKKKQEPPKDFLGKIFHYGPSIAENLVVPVLQRFDSATKVANDALETQKLELTNQAKMLEIKSQEIQHDKFKLEREAEQFKVRQGQIMNQNLAAQTMQNLQFGRAQAADMGLDRRRRSLQEKRMARESMEQQAVLAGIPQGMRQPIASQGMGAMMQPSYTMPPRQPMPVAQRPIQQAPAPQVNAPQPQTVIPQVSNPRVLGAGPDQATVAPEVLPTSPTLTARSALQALPSKIATRLPRAGIRKATRVPTRHGNAVPEELEELELAADVADEGMLTEHIFEETAPVFTAEHEEDSMVLENVAQVENKDLTAEAAFATNNSPAIENLTTSVSEGEQKMTQEVSEGFIKLAEFVQQRMADHDTPEGAATKLKLGVFAGLVPKEVFNEAIGTPFEELYRQVKLAAEQKGYSKVQTPKGETFCQNLYNKLKG